MAPAVAPGTRSCAGMPQATCEQAFQEADATARERGTVVVGIAVRCTAVCTAASGEAERSVTYGDGTSEQGGFGWQQAAPAPVGQPVGPEPSLPVAPTCVGLDARDLRGAGARVRSIASSVDSGIVVSIVVRCTPGPCTPRTRRRRDDDHARRRPGERDQRLGVRGQSVATSGQWLVVASGVMPLPTFRGDPYRVLDVDPGASDAAIKRRRRELARELHPDQAAGDAERTAELTKRMARVNAAYDLLRDEDRRREYDRAHPRPGSSGRAWAARSPTAMGR